MSSWNNRDIPNQSADAGAEHWVSSDRCSYRVGDDELHVFRMRIDGHDKIDSLERILSKDERQRAARFQREKVRSRFIRRRAALRKILAMYERLPPDKIDFSYNQFGKPYLADSSIGLEFSASSTDDYALIGVTRRNQVGVDIENSSRNVDLLSLAKRFFHPHEFEEIQSRENPDEQRDCFFHCWARKEAFVKALGRGLYIPLSSFQLTVTPIDARIVWVDRSVSDMAWDLRALRVDTNYVGALVFPKNANCQIRLFEFRSVW